MLVEGHTPYPWLWVEHDHVKLTMVG